MLFLGQKILQLCACVGLAISKGSCQTRNSVGVARKGGGRCDEEKRKTSGARRTGQTDGRTDIRRAEYTHKSGSFGELSLSLFLSHLCAPSSNCVRKSPPTQHSGCCSMSTHDATLLVLVADQTHTVDRNVLSRICQQRE